MPEAMGCQKEAKVWGTEKGKSRAATEPRGNCNNLLGKLGPGHRFAVTEGQNAPVQDVRWSSRYGRRSWRR